VVNDYKLIPEMEPGLETRTASRQKVRRFAHPKGAAKGAAIDTDREHPDLAQQRTQPPADPLRAALQARSLVDLDPAVKPRAAMVDRVYEFLKYQILTCEMPPGQAIDEKEVCDALSISRTPFREAVNRLSSEGLVNASHYRAYQVAPLIESDIINLCELRTMIEADVAALAAQRGTPADVKRLESLVDLPPAAQGNHRSYLAANSAFHSALAKCCQNARLVAIYLSVMDQLQRPFYLVGHLVGHDANGLDLGMDLEKTAAEHHEIVKAIREGDSAKAREAVVDATSHTKTMLLRALRTHGFV